MNITKNKKVLLVFLIVAIIIVGIVSFYLVGVSITKLSEEKTSMEDGLSSFMTSSTLENFETRTLVQFDGTYIQAELPENWSIAEYDDENGMEIGVMDDGYNGLTGFDINNFEGKTIFQFRGVNGVGDSGLCSEIFQFSDTDQDYVQRKVDAWNEYGDKYEAKVLDLSVDSYTESTLFDRVYRRIGDTFYWKHIDSPEGIFNPECGMWSAYVFFQATGITLVGAYPLEIFSANIISDNVQDNDLVLLDNVLKSIQIK